jgi:hypothetical protein
MARAVEQITTAGRVQVEEDTRHHNHLLLQTCLEEVEAVGNLIGKTLEIQPAVSCINICAANKKLTSITYR